MSISSMSRESAVAALWWWRARATVCERWKIYNDLRALEDLIEGVIGARLKHSDQKEGRCIPIS
jgi:hypothetical protein